MSNGGPGNGNNDKLIGSLSGHDYTSSMPSGWSVSEYDAEVQNPDGSYSVSGNVAGKKLRGRQEAWEIAKKKWPGKYANMSLDDYSKEVDAYWVKKGITPAKYAAGRQSKLTHTQKANKVVQNTSKTSSQSQGGGGAGGGQQQSQSMTQSMTGPTINITNSGSGGGGGGAGNPLADNGGSPIDKLLGRLPQAKGTFKKTTGRRNTTTQGGNTPYKFRGLQNQFESWQMNHYDTNNDKTT